jgi:DNA-binding MarR family transcriptional regulator
VQFLPDLISPGAAVTTFDTQAGSAGPVSGHSELHALSEQLPRFGRLIHAFKAQQAAANRDRAALVLLYPLVRIGPLRQGALAELVHADPSTVSRHVALLVERGLVTRVADESDGRASRLVVTDAGRATLEQLRAEREAHLAHATTGWSHADLQTFTTLLGRFLDDLSAALPVDTGCPSTAVPEEK